MVIYSYFSPYCDLFTNLLWEPAATSFVPETSNIQVVCQLQKPKIATKESVKCFMDYTIHTRVLGCTAGSCQGLECSAEGRASSQQFYQRSCGISWPASLVCLPMWALPLGHSSTTPPSAQTEELLLCWERGQGHFNYSINIKCVCWVFGQGKKITRN